MASVWTWVIVSPAASIHKQCSRRGGQVSKPFRNGLGSRANVMLTHYSPSKPPTPLPRPIHLPSRLQEPRTSNSRPTVPPTARSIPVYPADRRRPNAFHSPTRIRHGNLSLRQNPQRPKDSTPKRPTPKATKLDQRFRASRALLRPSRTSFCCRRRLRRWAF